MKKTTVFVVCISLFSLATVSQDEQTNSKMPVVLESQFIAMNFQYNPAL